MTFSMTLKPILLLGGLSIGAALTTTAQTANVIIAKARAYLGGDAALNAIQSVHFNGILETAPVTATGSTSEKYSVDIIFQKPCQQRIVARTADLIETTALDDYIGWHRQQGARENSRVQVGSLDAGQIKVLRANTWENLEFFKGIEQTGGNAEVVGHVTVEGKPAVKLAFRHDEGIVFFRYFDPVTGRLLLSETGQGVSIKEEGEIVINGVRFPQKTIQTSKGVDATGKPVELKQVVTFEKITLNEVFPESDFELPSLSAASPPPAATPPGTAAPGLPKPAPAPSPAGG